MPWLDKADSPAMLVRVSSSVSVPVWSFLPSSPLPVDAAQSVPALAAFGGFLLQFRTKSSAQQDVAGCRR